MPSAVGQADETTSESAARAVQTCQIAEHAGLWQRDVQPWHDDILVGVDTQPERECQYGNADQQDPGVRMML